MNKTIFISSTFEDLKNHRRGIWDLLAKYDVNIRGMENFGARTEAPLTTCLTEVEQSDIFIGVIGFKLGSIDKAREKSFTQLEYEHAFELGNKNIYIYLMDEKDTKMSVQDIDFGQTREKLIAFKKLLKDRHTVDFFVSEGSLIDKLRTKFDEILSLKKDENKEFLDEHDHAKTVIEKFLLLPKVFSGEDIKLNIDFLEEPFSASKQICSGFNLDYGATIGVKIKINKPSLSKELTDIVFITSKDVEEYFNFNKKTNVDIYGKLQFSENNINDIKANFIRQVYYVVDNTLLNTAIKTNLENMLYGQKKVIEPEGKIILRLAKFIKN